MPASVLPNVTDFLFIRKNLLSWSYRDKNSQEIRKMIDRLGMIFPRKRKGREAGFIYSANGHDAKVWTSFLPEEGKARDAGEDYGWVLIAKGDRAVYYTVPFMRTANFVQNLCRAAWVIKWHINHIPNCRECKARMDIYQNPVTGATFYVCWRKERHENKKPKYSDWDKNLPPKAKAFVESRRKLRQNYREALKKAGKKVKPRRTTRKRAIITKSQNRI